MTCNHDCVGSSTVAKAKSNGVASIQEFFAGNHSNTSMKNPPDAMPAATPP